MLVDSRPLVENVWHRWGALRGIDPARFIAVCHGRRTSETIRMVAPELDARREAASLDAMEEHETAGLRAVPGASALLAALEPGEWAVVTSGSRAVATLRLGVAGLPLPDILVTGDTVKRGKPDPEGYLLAAERLGLAPPDCIVIEDTEPGIEAARSAGARVLAVPTTHPPERLGSANAIVPLSSLWVERPGPAGTPGPRFRLAW